MLKIEKFTVNPLGENSLVLSDETGECILVDPGFYSEAECKRVVRYLDENRLKPICIANTHGHFDHVMGVGFFKERYDLPFYLHGNDFFLVEQALDHAMMFGFDMEPVPMPDDEFPEEGLLRFGNTTLQVIPVPGHAPGHVVFYCEAAKILIAGDVLFRGSIGRTDLAGGNYKTLIEGIKSRLFCLPDDTVVYCGHGPETTLGHERATNPFLT
jgi:glyoxylase-like metal-dependent hydrolase (beta-lactamase superfamily II)